MDGILADNIMEYKITYKNQFKAIEGLLYSTIVFLIIVIYIYKVNGYDDGIPIIFGSAYSIIFIPTIFLHLEYYFINRKQLLFIDVVEKTILVGEERKVSFNEIEKIELFMPPVWHRKGFIKLLSFEEYRYAAVELKKGERYIFTCLMIRDLEKAMSTISGVTIEKKKRLIASPLIERLFFQ